MAGNRISSQSGPAGRPNSSKWSSLLACANPIIGTVFLIAERPLSSISCTRVSILVPVAASAFATDSVEGQRARPSQVMRFDLLNVVGSSPDFLARPDGESPARAARRSRAVQIWACVSVDIEAGTEYQKGILSDYGNYSLSASSNF